MHDSDAPGIQDLAEQLRALDQRCAALEAENTRLHAGTRWADPLSTVAPRGNEPVSRRGMLGSAAKVAAGVAALGAVGVLDARPAAAADGDPLKLGQSNNSTATTSLANNGSNADGIFVRATGSNSAGLHGIGTFAGVLGFSSSGPGIFGDSLDTTGVKGTTTFGTAIVAEASNTGATGVQATAVDGDAIDTSTTGLSRSAVFAHHEGDADHAGFGVFASSAKGVALHAEASAEDGIDSKSTGKGHSAVFAHHEGNASNAGFGVFASSVNGVALHAQVTGSGSAANGLEVTTAGTGHALLAQATSSSNATSAALVQNSGSGVGIRAISGTGAGGSFQGGRAAINLSPKSTTGRPTSGQHFAGDIVVDSTGKLFLCTKTGTPGTWVRVNVTAA